MPNAYETAKSMGFFYDSMPGGKMNLKTFSAKKEDVTRKWHIVDAEGRTLGRMASEVAKILRGKHKPIFTPHVDTGDFVIIVNADKVRLTGAKMDEKDYHHHSGYPGGLKVVKFKSMLKDKPIVVVREAIKGMLPHNRLGRAVIRKLKVYEGPDHPHDSQNPQPLEI